MEEREAIRKALRENPELTQHLHRLQQKGKLQTVDALPDDADVMVLCGPTSVVNGSKQARCGCGAIVWLAPSSQEMMAKRTGKSIPICFECMNADLLKRKTNEANRAKGTPSKETQQ